MRYIALLFLCLAALGQHPTFAQTAPLQVSTVSLPNGMVSEAYSWQLVASGGSPPYTWGWNGSLPPGFAFDAITGLLSGTPRTAGTYSLALRVVDSKGADGSEILSIDRRGCVCLFFGSGGRQSRRSLQEFTGRVRRESSVRLFDLFRHPTSRTGVQHDHGSFVWDTLSGRGLPV
jgi:Putative Ig domain